MTSWMREVLGKDTEQERLATELRDLQIHEISGVDDAAHGLNFWLVQKAASEGDPDRARLFAQLADLLASESAPVEKAAPNFLQLVTLHGRVILR